MLILLYIGAVCRSIPYRRALLPHILPIMNYTGSGKVRQGAVYMSKEKAHSQNFAHCSKCF